MHKYQVDIATDGGLGFQQVQARDKVEAKVLAVKAFQNAHGLKAIALEAHKLKE